MGEVLAQTRVPLGIERLAAGNPGDADCGGKVVSRLRIDYGPGRRVYYK